MSENAVRTRSIVVAVVVVVILSFLMPVEGTRDSNANLSSHVLGAGGGRGFYTVLESLGVDVSRWQTPLTERPGRTGVEALALLAPPQELDDDTLDWLFDWVAGGGLLVYVPSFDIDSFGEALGLEGGNRATPRPMPTPPEDLRWLVEELPPAMSGYSQLTDVTNHTADSVELLVAHDDESVAVARFAIGRGHVLMASCDPELLTVEALSQHEVEAIFGIRVVLAMLEGRGLVFDEYHHGYRDGVGVPAMLGTWLIETPGGWATIALLVLVVAALFVAGWRFGRALPAPPPPARSSLEHVDALADAFASSRAVARPATLLVEGLRRRWGLATIDDLRRRLDTLRNRAPDLSDDVRVIEHALPASGQTWTDRTKLATLCDAIDRVIGGVERT